MAATQTIQENRVLISLTQTTTAPQHRRVKFGLAEVDKLFEGREIKFPVSNYASRARRDNSHDKNTEDDLISNLPSDILGFIVSLLNMREGAATSILSKRWRNLWSTSVSHLILNDMNVFGYKIVERHQLFQESERTKFLTQVDHIFQQCNPLNIDTLLIHFPLEQPHAVHIDGWIKLAGRLTKLKLDCGCPSRMGFIYIHSFSYTFPFQSLSSSLTHLYLRLASIDFPHDFQNLKSLASLDLVDCHFNNDNVQNILSNCHSLEWLSLTQCVFPEHTILSFVGPSIRLKHLHIHNSFKVEKINVHDVSLESFELIMDEDVDLSIKNVPHLALLMLNTDGPLEIQDSLPRLQTLFLHHEESELPNLSVLSNLKRLVFMVDQDTSNLLEVTRFLAACPLLQQLELNMCDQTVGLTDQNSSLSSAPSCVHHHLTEVSIHGFDSHPELIDFSRYLLKNAVVLEKMIMHTTYQSYLGNGISILSKTSAKLLGMPVEKVREMLQKESRSFTEILIA